MSLAVVTEVAMSFIVYELWFYQIPAQQYIFRNFKAHIIQLMPILKPVKHMHVHFSQW